MNKKDASILLENNLNKLKVLINKKEKSVEDVASQLCLCSYCEVLETFISLPPDEFNKIKDSKKIEFEQLKQEVKKIVQDFNNKQNVRLTENMVDFLFCLKGDDISKMKCYKKSNIVEIVFIR